MVNSYGVVKLILESEKFLPNKELALFAAYVGNEEALGMLINKGCALSRAELIEKIDEGSQDGYISNAQELINFTGNLYPEN